MININLFVSTDIVLILLSLFIKDNSDELILIVSIWIIALGNYFFGLIEKKKNKNKRGR